MVLPELHRQEHFGMIRSALKIIRNGSLPPRHGREKKKRYETVGTARTLIGQKRFTQPPLGLISGGTSPVDPEPLKRLRLLERYDVLHTAPHGGMSGVVDADASNGRIVIRWLPPSGDGPGQCRKH